MKEIKKSNLSCYYKMNKSIEKIIRTPMSDSDIKYWLGKKAPIIEYSKLKNINAIEELLPKDKSFVVLLLERVKNNGHWCGIMRYGNIIEYFDPYGLKISSELDLNSEKKNEELGQEQKWLNNLLTESIGRWNIIYNKFDFQKLNNNIMTCGRWTCLRILKMQEGYDLNKFINYIKELKKKTGKPLDYIVSSLIK